VEVKVICRIPLAPHFHSFSRPPPNIIDMQTQQSTCASAAASVTYQPASNRLPCRSRKNKAMLHVVQRWPTSCSMQQPSIAPLHLRLTRLQ